MARPTKYTKVLAEKICARLADGESLRSICKDDDMPGKSVVFKWLLSDSSVYAGFRDQYDNARKIQYECMVDDIVDIADDGRNDFVINNTEEGDLARLNVEAIGRSRLRVDTRKWFLSKVLPKFSDKDPQENKKEDLASVIAKLIEKLPN